MLALNSAVCWNILCISKDNQQETLTSGSSETIRGDSFTHYFAGLIEGNGCLYTPPVRRSEKTGKLTRPYISLSFPLKDFPLAQRIRSKLQVGSLSRIKGKRAYNLVISSKADIVSVIKLLNGNMRTTKIASLYRMIA